MQTTQQDRQARREGSLGPRRRQQLVPGGVVGQAGPAVGSRAVGLVLPSLADEEVLNRRPITGRNRR